MKETLSRKQLKLLMEVSNVLNSSLNIVDTIDSIMRETINAIEAADGGVLFLYDEEEEVLVAKSAQGFEQKIVGNVKLKPGESMTGLAFLAKNCLIFPTQEQVRKTISSLSGYNFAQLESSIPNFPYSAICSPIIRNGKSIGVITLDCFHSEHHFTQEDINLLEAISHQAAVALEKANLYQEKETHLTKLQILNEKITEQNEVLTRSIDIHTTLTDLVLKGEGLHSIIQYIYDNMGYDAILLNEFGQVLASTVESPFSYEQTYHILTAAEQSRKNISSRPLKMNCSNGNELSVFIFHIGSAERNLGVLTILADNLISKMIIAALGHACTVISLEILKNHAIFDKEQSLKGEFIDELLADRLDDTFYQRAKHLRLPNDSHYSSVVFSFEALTYADKRVVNMKRQFIDFVQHYISQHFTNGMAVLRGDHVVVILSSEAQLSRAALDFAQGELIAYVKNLLLFKHWNVKIITGVGRYYDSLEKVKKSVNEALKCVQFIKSYGLKLDVLKYKDLGVQRLLLQNSKEELQDYVNETLGPLLTYESTKRSELLETLILYLDHNQNLKQTAEAMHIHLNTLSYRLKRAEKILDSDFSDSHQFLDVHMALNLYQYLDRSDS